MGIKYLKPLCSTQKVAQKVHLFVGKLKKVYHEVFVSFSIIGKKLNALTKFVIFRKYNKF